MVKDLDNSGTKMIFGLDHFVLLLEQETGENASLALENGRMLPREIQELVTDAKERGRPITLHIEVACLLAKEDAPEDLRKLAKLILEAISHKVD
jgi:GGDEF domain-containing protein